MDFKQALRILAVTAFAVLIASHTASGIYYDELVSLLVATILLSIFNIFLKPLLMLFSLPFILLTLGVGILVINAVLFLLVAYIVEGFYVDSFVSALWGGLLIGVINFVVTLYFGKPGEKPNFTVTVNRKTFSSNTTESIKSKKASLKDSDVIDI